MEDNEEQRRAIVRNLKAAENLGKFRIYKIFQAIYAEEAFEIVKANRLGLILLDRHFPTSPGMEAEPNSVSLCQRIRRLGVACPIIVISGEAKSAEDEIRCLEQGANDYIRKPYSPSVLMARILKQLTIIEQSDRAELVIDRWLFRTHSNDLIDAENRKLSLTAKESSILKRLYLAHGEVVLKSVLLREVWDYNPAVTSHTLETHIYRLRQKLEINPQSPRLLITHAGGYLLKS